MRAIWNGTGELDTDREVYFTKNDGTLVGRPYVRERVRRGLARWTFIFDKPRRDRVLALTVDNDEWLGFRNGMLAAAIVRDAVDDMVGGLGAQ